MKSSSNISATTKTRRVARHHGPRQPPFNSRKQKKSTHGSSLLQSQSISGISASRVHSSSVSIAISSNHADKIAARGIKRAAASPRHQQNAPSVLSRRSLCLDAHSMMHNHGNSLSLMHPTSLKNGFADSDPIPRDLHDHSPSEYWTPARRIAQHAPSPQQAVTKRAIEEHSRRAIESNGLVHRHTHDPALGPVRRLCPPTATADMIKTRASPRFDKTHAMTKTAQRSFSKPFLAKWRSDTGHVLMLKRFFNTHSKPSSRSPHMNNSLHKQNVQPPLPNQWCAPDVHAMNPHLTKMPSFFSPRHPAYRYYKNCIAKSPTAVFNDEMRYLRSCNPLALSQLFRTHRHDYLLVQETQWVYLLTSLLNANLELEFFDHLTYLVAFRPINWVADPKLVGLIISGCIRFEQMGVAVALVTQHFSPSSVRKRGTMSTLVAYQPESISEHTLLLAYRYLFLSDYNQTVTVAPTQMDFKPPYLLGYELAPSAELGDLLIRPLSNSYTNTTPPKSSISDEGRQDGETLITRQVLEDIIQSSELQQYYNLSAASLDPYYAELFQESFKSVVPDHGHSIQDDHDLIPSSVNLHRIYPALYQQTSIPLVSPFDTPISTIAPAQFEAFLQSLGCFWRSKYNTAVSTSYYLNNPNLMDSVAFSGRYAGRLPSQLTSRPTDHTAKVQGRHQSLMNGILDLAPMPNGDICNPAILEIDTNTRGSINQLLSTFTPVQYQDTVDAFIKIRPDDQSVMDGDGDGDGNRPPVAIINGHGHVFGHGSNFFTPRSISLNQNDPELDSCSPLFATIYGTDRSAPLKQQDISQYHNQPPLTYDERTRIAENGLIEGKDPHTVYLSHASNTDTSQLPSRITLTPPLKTNDSISGSFLKEFHTKVVLRRNSTIHITRDEFKQASSDLYDYQYDGYDGGDDLVPDGLEKGRMQTYTPLPGQGKALSNDEYLALHGSNPQVMAIAPHIIDPITFNTAVNYHTAQGNIGQKELQSIRFPFATLHVPQTPVMRSYANHVLDEKGTIISGPFAGYNPSFLSVQRQHAKPQQHDEQQDEQPQSDSPYPSYTPKLSGSKRAGNAVDAQSYETIFDYMADSSPVSSLLPNSNVLSQFRHAYKNPSMEVTDLQTYTSPRLTAGYKETTPIPSVTTYSRDLLRFHLTRLLTFNYNIDPAGYCFSPSLTTDAQTNPEYQQVLNSISQRYEMLRQQNVPLIMDKNNNQLTASVLTRWQQRVSLLQSEHENRSNPPHGNHDDDGTPHSRLLSIPHIDSLHERLQSYLQLHKKTVDDIIPAHDAIALLLGFQHAQHRKHSLTSRDPGQLTNEMSSESNLIVDSDRDLVIAPADVDILYTLGYSEYDLADLHMGTTINRYAYYKYAEHINNTIFSLIPFVVSRSHSTDLLPGRKFDTKCDYFSCSIQDHVSPRLATSISHLFSEFLLITLQSTLRRKQSFYIDHLKYLRYWVENIDQVSVETPLSQPIKTKSFGLYPFPHPFEHVILNSSLLQAIGFDGSDQQEKLTSNIKQRLNIIFGASHHFVRSNNAPGRWQNSHSLQYYENLFANNQLNTNDMPQISSDQTSPGQPTENGGSTDASSSKMPTTPSKPATDENTEVTYARHFRPDLIVSSLRALFVQPSIRTSDVLTAPLPVFVNYPYLVQSPHIVPDIHGNPIILQTHTLRTLHAIRYASVDMRIVPPIYVDIMPSTVNSDQPRYTLFSRPPNVMAQSQLAQTNDQHVIRILESGILSSPVNNFLPSHYWSKEHLAVYYNNVNTGRSQSLQDDINRGNGCNEQPDSQSNIMRSIYSKSHQIVNLFGRMESIFDDHNSAFDHSLKKKPNASNSTVTLEVVSDDTPQRSFRLPNVEDAPIHKIIEIERKQQQSQLQQQDSSKPSLESNRPSNMENNILKPHTIYSAPSKPLVMSWLALIIYNKALSLSLTQFPELMSNIIVSLGHAKDPHLLRLLLQNATKYGYNLGRFAYTAMLLSLTHHKLQVDSMTTTIFSSPSHQPPGPSDPHSFHKTALTAPYLVEEAIYSKTSPSVKMYAPLFREAVARTDLPASLMWLSALLHSNIQIRHSFTTHHASTSPHIYVNNAVALAHIALPKIPLSPEESQYRVQLLALNRAQRRGDTIRAAESDLLISYSHGHHAQDDQLPSDITDRAIGDGGLLSLVAKTTMGDLKKKVDSERNSASTIDLYEDTKSTEKLRTMVEKFHRAELEAVNDEDMIPTALELNQLTSSPSSPDDSGYMSSLDTILQKRFIVLLNRFSHFYPLIPQFTGEFQPYQQSKVVQPTSATIHNIMSVTFRTMDSIMTQLTAELQRGNINGIGQYIPNSFIYRYMADANCQAYQRAVANLYSSEERDNFSPQAVSTAVEHSQLPPFDITQINLSFVSPRTAPHTQRGLVDSNASKIDDISTLHFPQDARFNEPLEVVLLRNQYIETQLEPQIKLPFPDIDSVLRTPQDVVHFTRLFLKGELQPTNTAFPSDLLPTMRSSIMDSIDWTSITLDNLLCLAPPPSEISLDVVANRGRPLEAPGEESSSQTSDILQEPSEQKQFIQEFFNSPILAANSHIPRSLLSNYPITLKRAVDVLIEVSIHYSVPSALHHVLFNPASPPGLNLPRVENHGLPARDFAKTKIGNIWDSSLTELIIATYTNIGDVDSIFDVLKKLHRQQDKLTRAIQDISGAGSHPKSTTFYQGSKLDSYFDQNPTKGSQSMVSLPNFHDFSYESFIRMLTSLSSLGYFQHSLRLLYNIRHFLPQNIQKLLGRLDHLHEPTPILDSLNYSPKIGDQQSVNTILNHVIHLMKYIPLQYHSIGGSAVIPSHRWLSPSQLTRFSTILQQQMEVHQSYGLTVHATNQTGNSIPTDMTISPIDFVQIHRLLQSSISTSATAGSHRNVRRLAQLIRSQDFSGNIGQMLIYAYHTFEDHHSIAFDYSTLVTLDNMLQTAIQHPQLVSHKYTAFHATWATTTSEFLASPEVDPKLQQHQTVELPPVYGRYRSYTQQQRHHSHSDVNYANQVVSFLSSITPQQHDQIMQYHASLESIHNNTTSTFSSRPTSSIKTISTKKGNIGLVSHEDLQQHQQTVALRIQQHRALLATLPTSITSSTSGSDHAHLHQPTLLDYRLQLPHDPVTSQGVPLPLTMQLSNTAVSLLSSPLFLLSLPTLLRNHNTILTHLEKLSNTPYLQSAIDNSVTFSVTGLLNRQNRKAGQDQRVQQHGNRHHWTRGKSRGQTTQTAHKSHQSLRVTAKSDKYVQFDKDVAQTIREITSFMRTLFPWHSYPSPTLPSTQNTHSDPTSDHLSVDDDCNLVDYLKCEPKINQDTGLLDNVEQVHTAIHRYVLLTKILHPFDYAIPHRSQNHHSSRSTPPHRGQRQANDLLSAAPE